MEEIPGVLDMFDSNGGLAVFVDGDVEADDINRTSVLTRWGGGKRGEVGVVGHLTKHGRPLVWPAMDTAVPMTARNASRGARRFENDMKMECKKNE